VYLIKKTMLQVSALAIHIFVPIAWGVGMFFLFQLLYRRRAGAAGVKAGAETKGAASRAAENTDRRARRSGRENR
jgi:hypothetical protein